ncbi:hypothetical protein AMECASPLE_026871 [Ameca splendens]|uniref:Uncharacterized protein n=1 Tax=Ameca splendens TaxID=208324 RepID=A0ABV1AC93_9TELE
MEDYKKAGLSALQCLSVMVTSKSRLHAPVFSLVLASSLSQPPAKVKTSSLQELFWIKFQWTAQALRLLRPSDVEMRLFEA